MAEAPPRDPNVLRVGGNSFGSWRDIDFFNVQSDGPGKGVVTKCFGDGGGVIVTGSNDLRAVFSKSILSEEFCNENFIGIPFEIYP